MATTRPTMSGGAGREPSVTPAPLPSVLDLGRRIRVLLDTYDRHDEQKLKLRKEDIPAIWSCERAMRLADDREDALRELVMTLPARSLGDAAVQVYEAVRLIGHLEDFEHDASALRAHLLQLRRVVCSVFPVVVAAAGVDPVTIAGPDALETCAAEFPTVEGA